MERRYQVFVSSTYEDLKSEREGVLRALLSIDCFPAAMEGFGAASATPWDIIKAAIDLCDYYIVITAGKYGSEEGGISYTEREYDYAKAMGIPCLAFVYADPDRLPNNLVEQSSSKRSKLLNFQSKLQNSHLLEKWNNGDDLKYRVVTSLTNEMKRNPRSGWVRASETADTDIFQKLEAVRTENERLERRLKAALEREPALIVNEIANYEIVVDFDDQIIEDSVETNSAILAKQWLSGKEFRWNGLEILRVIGPFLHRGISARLIKYRITSVSNSWTKSQNFRAQMAHASLLESVISERAYFKTMMMFDMFELTRQDLLATGERNNVETHWLFTDFGRRVYAHAFGDA